MTVNFRLSLNHESLFTYFALEGLLASLYFFRDFSFKICRTTKRRPNDGTIGAKTIFYSNSNLNIYASSLLFVDVIAYGPFFSSFFRQNEIVKIPFLLSANLSINQPVFCVRSGQKLTVQYRENLFLLILISLMHVHTDTKLPSFNM